MDLNRTRARQEAAQTVAAARDELDGGDRDSAALDRFGQPVDGWDGGLRVRTGAELPDGGQGSVMTYIGDDGQPTNQTVLVGLCVQAVIGGDCGRDECADCAEFRDGAA